MSTETRTPPERAGAREWTALAVLGVPAVLDALATVATRADVPAGAKFETFAFLDRVLGLDLAREVGHQHRAAT